MPKLAANLSTLYNEHVFLDRFAAARADGFAAVELQFPYAFPKEEICGRKPKTTAPKVSPGRRHTSRPAHR
jgi:hydroxypyruvate isomerase